jgi:hypothetical protein
MRALIVLAMLVAGCGSDRSGCDTTMADCPCHYTDAPCDLIGQVCIYGGLRRFCDGSRSWSSGNTVVDLSVPDLAMHDLASRD